MIMGSVFGVLDVLFGYLLGLALSKSEYLRQKLEPADDKVMKVENFLKRWDGKIGSKNFLATKN
jgi:hypothetical protein